MKAKVVYFSQDGNIRKIAQRIAEELKIETVELIPVKRYPNNFLKFILGGKDTVFKVSPVLDDYSRDTEYDLIFIGTPIWAGCFAPPIRTFLSDADYSGAKLAYFCSSKSGNGEKSFELIKNAAPKYNFVSFLSLKDSENGKNAMYTKAVEWAKSVKKELIFK